MDATLPSKTSAEKTGILFFRVENILPILRFGETSWWTQELQQPPDRFHELVELGAVYVNQKRLPELTEIGSESLFQAGDILRIHTRPKRFLGPADKSLTNPPLRWCEMNWQSRRVAESADYLIINKPSGLPVHPTVDNRKENLLHFLRESVNPYLEITHRLDVGTEGLLVLAKNVTAQRRFQMALQERKVSKEYAALVPGGSPFFPGQLLRHWMEPSLRAPRVLRNSNPEVSSESKSPAPEGYPFSPGTSGISGITEKNEKSFKSEKSWKECRSVIVSVEKLRWPPEKRKSGDCIHNRDEAKPSVPHQENPQLPEIDQIQLRLETGRTHQLRSQLAFEGSPILGDEMYGSTALWASGCWALRATMIEFFGERYELPLWTEN